METTRNLGDVPKGKAFFLGFSTQIKGLDNELTCSSLKHLPCLHT